MAKQTAKKREPGQAPSRYRWVVFLILASGYLLVYFHRLCPAVVALDLMNDLGAGGGLIGLLASAYFYPYALMQIPSGLLSDSWGPRKTISLSFALAGAASIFFGLALSAGWAIFARVLVGLGVSMFFVPTMKILTRWFRVSEFAFMAGILMAVGGLGALSAATPLAYLSAAVGWRGSFVAIGALTLVLAGAIWFLVRNSPEEMGLPAVEAPKPKDQPSQKIGLGQGVKMVLGRGRFWPLSGWFFFTFGIFFSFGGLWGGPYLMHVYGLSKPQAGGILSMLAVAMIFGGPLASLISDKWLGSRKKLLVPSSVATVLLTIPLAFFPDGMNLPLLYVWSLLLGFFASAVVVVGFASAKELFPVEIAGTAVGVVNLFPFLAGALAQPLLGLILDAHGKGPDGYSTQAYGHAFMVYFVSALAALVSSCFIKETLGQPTDRKSP
ncbi:MAG: MFS transporter [Thermodesulfobacteriota bacterium]|nr:MFS transporter [Thermodesulfobacteriota bacterium]